jgi:hypothetical protein
MLGANPCSRGHGRDRDHRRQVGLDIRGASGARGPRCTRELVAVSTRCDCPQDSVITGNVIQAHSVRRTDFARVADRGTEHRGCAGGAPAPRRGHCERWLCQPCSRESIQPDRPRRARDHAGHRRYPAAVPRARGDDPRRTSEELASPLTVVTAFSTSDTRPVLGVSYGVDPVPRAGSGGTLESSPGAGPSIDSITASPDVGNECRERSRCSCRSRRRCCSRRCRWRSARSRKSPY